MFKKKEKSVEVKKKGKSILPIAALMALIVAIALYLVAVRVEKDALSDYEKGVIYVTKAEVPANVVITEENVDTYFAEMQLDLNVIPENAVTDKATLYGKAPVFAMDSKMTVTTGMFADINAKVEAMSSPRLAALGSDDLSQIVSGTVRAGDTVDIYVIEPEKDGETATPDFSNKTPAFSDVYVMEAFDSAGTSITNDDDVSICQRVNILYESDKVFDFYKELQKGTTYIVKHIDSTTK